MSWDSLEKAVKMIDTGVHALETAQQLTKLGGPEATLALTLIDTILTAVIAGFGQKATPEAIQADMAAMATKLATNDATANSAIADKFKTT